MCRGVYLLPANGDLIANTITPTLAIWVTDPSAQPHRIAALGGEGSDSVVSVDGRIVTSNRSELVVHDTDGSNPAKLRSYSPIYRQLARCGPQHVVYWASDDKNQSHIARTDIVSGDDLQTYRWATRRRAQLYCRWFHSDFRPLPGRRQPLPSHPEVPRFRAVSYSLRSWPRTWRQCRHSNPVSGWHERSLPGSPARNGMLKNPYDWATVVPGFRGEPKRFKMPVPPGEVDSFTWAPDGKSIPVRSQRTWRLGTSWSTPLDGRPPKKLTSFESDLIFSFGVSPDNRLAISRGINVRDVVLISNVR